MIIEILKKIKSIQEQKTMNSEITLISDSNNYLDLDDTKTVIYDF